MASRVFAVNPPLALAVTLTMPEPLPASAVSGSPCEGDASALVALPGAPLGALMDAAPPPVGSEDGRTGSLISPQPTAAPAIPKTATTKPKRTRKVCFFIVSLQWD
jgi:hypothetical protein